MEPVTEGGRAAGNGATGSVAIPPGKREMSEKQDYQTLQRAPRNCRERWGFSRVRAHQLIGAAETVTGLLTTVNTPMPGSERQARALGADSDRPGANRNNCSGQRRASSRPRGVGVTA